MLSNSIENTNIVEEIYEGMNKKHYHNQYFIYHIRNEYQDRILEIRDNNVEQQKEISGIRWVSIKEIKEESQDINVEIIDHYNYVIDFEDRSKEEEKAPKRSKLN